jgi:hypothetical protein
MSRDIAERVRRAIYDTFAAQGHAPDLRQIQELWRLASGWYSGRLDSPYQRKDPQCAVDYFRSVGLHGPFWGLND